jgi:hypothetical protein
MAMDKYTVMPVDKPYNKEMLSILEASPVNANGISVYFDKSPNIFHIPDMKYTASDHLGFFKENVLKGFGSLGYFDALVQKQQANVFSFYNFYLLPEARGNKLPYLAMQKFFTAIQGKANYGISITMKGNRSAESYIGRQLTDWMPPTRVIDELVVK